MLNEENTAKRMVLDMFGRGMTSKNMVDEKSAAMVGIKTKEELNPM